MRSAAAQRVIDQIADGGAVAGAGKAMADAPIAQRLGGRALARLEIGQNFDGGGKASGKVHGWSSDKHAEGRAPSHAQIRREHSQRRQAKTKQSDARTLLAPTCSMAWAIAKCDEQPAQDNHDRRTLPPTPPEQARRANSRTAQATRIWLCQRVRGLDRTSPTRRGCAARHGLAVRPSSAELAHPDPVRRRTFSQIVSTTCTSTAPISHLSST